MMREIRVKRVPRDPCKGFVQAGSLTFPCALGRGGPSIFKREGDGATPAMAQLRPLWGYWNAERGPKPVSRLGFIPSRTDEGWCDAPTHPAYNEAVRLPFPASHETLRRDDMLYDICVVLDWNMRGHGRLRHKGSAIFMHVARPGYTPTEGCIALAEPDLRRVLKIIGRDTSILVER